jgi:hypothetical protein
VNDSTAGNTVFASSHRQRLAGTDFSTQRGNRGIQLPQANTSGPDLGAAAKELGGVRLGELRQCPQQFPVPENRFGALGQHTEDAQT